MDNRFVPSSSTPIGETDGNGNTYQHRRLENGERYSVLKNFPEKTELQEILTPEADDIQILELTYFWICRYRTKPSAKNRPFGPYQQRQ